MLYSFLKKHLNPGVILTPNKRLSRHLSNIWIQRESSLWKEKVPTEEKNNSGEAIFAIDAPQIYPIDEWFKSIYREQLESGQQNATLLNHKQIYLLWRNKMLEAIKNNDTLSHLNINHTVGQMRQAQELLVQWCVRPNQLKNDPREETQLFLAWLEKIEQTAKKNTWIFPESIPENILAPFLKKEATYPITLWGFNEITPQIGKFFNSLKQAKWIITYPPSPKYVSNKQLYAAQTKDLQYYAMANWAKEQYEQGQKSVACLIPELTIERARINRIFTEVFYSQKLFAQQSEDSVFNISVGTALNELPIIKIIFQLLDLLKPQLYYTQISNVLLSPFIKASQQESNARIITDLALRDSILADVYHHYLPTKTLAYAPIFCQLWQGLTTEFIAARTEQKKLLPWLDWLTEFLTFWGWPGDAHLINKAEYQQYLKWKKLLEDIALCSNFCPELSFNEFIDLLSYFTEKETYQIKTKSAPIQILGILEGSGSIYESLWVADLNDESWPPPANPNAYIPLALQKKLSMPNASNERQYNYSSVLLNGWLQSSESIVFSYAQNIDNQTYQPSGLLEPLELVTYNPSTDFCKAAHQLAQKNDLICEQESAYLPVTHKAQGEALSAQLLEQQINCPFQAFALQRLKSTNWRQPEALWSPRLRGNHLHKILEKFWSKVKDSTTLAKLSPELLVSKINHFILETLEPELKKYGLGIEHFSAQIEKERLSLILNEWLTLEKTRPDFSVLHTEYKQIKTLAGIAINYRIDRIDKSQDQILIIDYKSSSQNPKDWFTEPPNKPQLLLYALLFEQHVSIIAYATLKPTAIDLVGISELDYDFGGIKNYQHYAPTSVENWSNLKTLWQKQLEQVVEQFLNGLASIRPRHAKVCQTCHLMPLCRIQQS